MIQKKNPTHFKTRADDGGLGTSNKCVSILAPSQIFVISRDLCFFTPDG